MVKVGERYGRFLVTGRDGRRAICLCDCGKEKRVWASSLNNGYTLSCGCLRSERITKRNTTHGMTGTKEFKAWMRMKQRCSPSYKHSKYYYDRGISVCKQWANSFEEFYTHIGPAPTKHLTVDRVDNDGNYEPGNVRWATRAEQQANREVVEHVVLRGIKKAAFEWCEILGIVSAPLFCERRRNGWDTMKALLSRPVPPNGTAKPITDIELDELLKGVGGV